MTFLTGFKSSSFQSNFQKPIVIARAFYETVTEQSPKQPSTLYFLNPFHPPHPCANVS